MHSRTKQWTEKTDDAHIIIFYSYPILWSYSDLDLRTLYIHMLPTHIPAWKTNNKGNKATDVNLYSQHD